MLALSALLLCACGGEETLLETPPPLGCSVGDRTLEDGSCAAPGVPEDGCGVGFIAESNGCVPVRAADCAPGSMSLPGDEGCRPVGRCAPGKWGDAPAEATTEYVDGAFSGVSAGSAQAPWTTIAEAIAAAAPGAVVAIADGSYAEDLVISDKAVQLIGRCAQSVTLVGSGAAPVGVPAAITLRRASGSVLSDLAITGVQMGVVVTGSQDVLLEQLWIHDTGSYGARFDGELGASTVTLRDSLVENAVDGGVVTFLADLTLERSSLRDLGPSALGSYGRGVDAFTASPGDARAMLWMSDSVVERAYDSGVLAYGADAVVERSVVEHVLSDSGTAALGVGISAQPSAAGGATLSVQQSVVRAASIAAIHVSGSQVDIGATVMRDGEAAAVVGLGRGLNVQDDPVAGRSSVNLVQSLVDSVLDVGVFVGGSDFSAESLRVRNTRPAPSHPEFGRGIAVQGRQDGSEPSHVVVVSSAVEASHEGGIVILDSQLELSNTRVSATAAQLSSGGFGDGVSVVTWLADGVATVSQSLIEDSARAGLAGFGAVVVLKDTTLSCNSIDLAGETVGMAALRFDDGGGNRCGCESSASCQLLSSMLAPPEPLP